MTGLPTLVAGIALLIACALPLTLALRLRGAIAQLLALLLVAAAVVVVVTIALSLGDSLQPGWMLLGEALAAAAAVAAWNARGRPAPQLGFALPSSRAVLDWVRAHPAAAGLGVVAAIALATQLVMGIAVAPNNWDSMTYHLARVGYWLQLDSVLHFDGGTARQLANPPNGEYLQGWTMLLSGGDRLANAVQWVALVGLATAIAGMARALSFDRPAALFAASLFVVMPQPILQASTTQNDLIVSLFVVAAMLFGLRALRDRSTSDAAMFALAVGLAVGTKGTALVALPALAGVLAIAAWRYAAPARLLARGAAAALAAVVLLGSLNYVQTEQTFGDPFGPLSTLTERQSSLDDNAIRAGWSFADSSGVAMPWLDWRVERTADAILGDRTTRQFSGYSIDARVHEDTSAFGLIGIAALAVFAFALLAPRSRWDRRLIAAAAFAYLGLLVVLNEQNPWFARLMMPGMAIGAPLLALLHQRGWMRATAIVLALLTLVPCLLTNPLKPIRADPSQPSAFSLDRQAQQALARPDVAPALSKLDERLARDAPLGFVGDEDSWDYPFFGDGLERRLVRLEPDRATPETMRRLGLAGIVVANVAPPPRLQAEPLADDYWLAVRRPGGPGLSAAPARPAPAP